MAWNGHERRRNRGLTDEDFESIARRAAEIAEDAMERRWFERLGRDTAELTKKGLKRFLLFLGAVLCAGFVAYLQAKYGLVFPTGLKP